MASVGHTRDESRFVRWKKLLGPIFHERMCEDLPSSVPKFLNEVTTHVYRCSVADCEFSPLCIKVKDIVHRARGCRGPSECRTCKVLFNVFFYHVTQCQVDECPVPFCTRVKMVLSSTAAAA